MSAVKIEEAKRRLPLPELMRQLGYGGHVNTCGNAHCPFHDDQHPSFSSMKKTEGTWFWRCWAGCEQGDEIDLLAKVRGLSNNEAIKEYLSMAGVATTRPKQPFLHLHL
jgi:DNA primase